MMNRRKNKSRPLSVVSQCNTSPILCRSSRPSSACSSAVPHSLSLSFTWQDTNNNSNYDSRSEPWNNFQIAELSRSPTNFRRKIFTLTSPTESPLVSPAPQSPCESSPQSPTLSPVHLPNNSPCQSSPQSPTLSPVHSPNNSPSHSPSQSPTASRKSSSEGEDSKCDDSCQSTPILGQTPRPDRRNSSPSSSDCSSLNKFTELVNGDTFTTSYSSPVNNERRYMVIGEIIDTERKYVRNLEVLLNGYLPALEHVVAPRDLRLLFPAQLEPIMEKHKELLSQLEGRVSARSAFPDIVGDIFARLCGSNSEFLNIYSAYLNEFKVAVKTLAKYEQSSSQFRELLSMCQYSPFCEGLSLASYLLTPVQRLPRYELLLKELLKHTPVDHPDNYCVSDGLDKLHEEMIRLNQSIKSCQLACSVRRVQSRKSFRFSRGVRRSSSRISAATQLKRHVSTTNIDEISSGGDSCLYRSVENLTASMRREDGGLEQSEDEGSDYHTRSLMEGRAISCSDLLLDIERPKSFRSTLHSIPSTPEPPKLASSPLVVMRRSIAGDDGVRSRSRLSTYSTASSTSGIGSIDQSQLDLTSGSLTPTEQNPLCSSTPIHMTNVPVNSFLATIQQQMALASIHEDRPSSGRLKPVRKMSWVNFRLPRKMKKGTRSASLSQIIDISAPMDFRHIQHGFSPSDLTATDSNALTQSSTITDSNPGSSNTLTPS